MKGRSRHKDHTPSAGRTADSKKSQRTLRPRAYSNRQLGSDGLPTDVVEDGIIAYFTCFHAQPYNLLCQDSSLGPNCSLDPVVLNPMLALSIRCSSHKFWTTEEKINDWICALTERSWHDLLQRYGEGDTSLAYLQGLCLLAQVDFAGMMDHVPFNVLPRLTSQTGGFKEPILRYRSASESHNRWAISLNLLMPTPRRGVKK